MQNSQKSLFDEIPGYREALESEREQRELPFIDAPEFIAGVEVLSMSFWHLNALRCIKSPFLSGGMPMPQDVPLFMWIVSPQYAAIRGLAYFGLFPKLSRWILRFFKYRFVRRHRKLPFEKSVEEIYSYCESALGESEGSSVDGPSYYANVVPTVCILSCELGWSEKDIIHMPLKKVFQYSKGITKMHDPRAVLWNKSDELVGAWLAERNSN